MAQLTAAQLTAAQLTAAQLIEKKRRRWPTADVEHEVTLSVIFNGNRVMVVIWYYIDEDGERRGTITAANEADQTVGSYLMGPDEARVSVVGCRIKAYTANGSLTLILTLADRRKMQRTLGMMP